LGKTVAHSYTATGTYTVTLTVTDHAGQQTTTTFQVTIAAGAPPVARAGGPYVFGEKDASFGVWTATLDGRASTDDVGIFDYQWAFPPELTDDFTGTVLDTTKWVASTGVTQNGKATVVGAGTWGNRYLFSTGSFDRAGRVFQARVTPFNTTGSQFGM